MTILKSTAARRPEARRADRTRRHLGIESLEARKVLSTLTVSNVNDSGTGSLRAAILQADRDTTADTIVFSGTLANKSIKPLTALPLLNNTNLTLNGSGASGLTIDVSDSYKADSGDGSVANGTGNGLVVAYRSTAAVENLSLVNASSRAVEVDGTATLQNLSIGGSRNGGLVNFGTTTVVDSYFTANSAIRYGGAIDNSGGTLTVEGTMFSGNVAPEGGAIDVYGGTVTIGDDAAGQDTEFLSNGLYSGSSTGGAISMSGGSKVAITGAEFDDNFAAIGGAIDNQQGQLAVTGSSFYSNKAMYGGAIDDFATSAHPTTLSGCDLEYNSATFGGGIYVDGVTITLSGGTAVMNNNSPQGSDIDGSYRRTS